MNWTRHSGVMVSLALLASVVGHLAIVRQGWNPQTGSVHGHRVAPLHVDDGELFGTSERPPSPVETSLFGAAGPSDAGVPQGITSSKVMLALQTLESDDDSTAQAPAPQTGSGVPLPLEPSAVPKEVASGGDNPDRDKQERNHPGFEAVRRVIDAELLGTSQEERDIWFEELKSLPANVVRDLLQVRKQLRALPRALHQPDAVIPVAPNVADVRAESVSQTTRQWHSDWSSSLVALDEATGIAKHNLSNALTPGFKRIRWTLVDAGHSQSAESTQTRPGATMIEGCRLAVTTLDLQPGKLLKTGRSLDIAVDGDGFFVVKVDRATDDRTADDRTADDRDGDDQTPNADASANDAIEPDVTLAVADTLYTRCGALTLDAKRRLCLAVIEKSAVLQPEIVIPANAREVQISADGAVLVLRELGKDPEPLGRLQLAMFPAPTRLKSVGETLLEATVASGVAELSEPSHHGRGAIQQGCLEQANVSIERELADIEQLLTLSKSLATPTGSSPRSVTASGATPSTR